ncbi:hypothetical protein ACIQUQ_29715 [Streptomyces sp. NPDC101118]|uniref:hypothetical protein n=1 Tax=Streptomyces sp. NPDC101118 TaxID=3366109 RepID=UPI00381BE622
MSKHVCQLVGDAEIMFPLALIGIGVSVGLSSEFLVVHPPDPPPVSLQRFSLDICIGVFFAESSPILADAFSLLVEHLGADSSLAGVLDFIRPRQEVRQGDGSGGRRFWLLNP